MPKDYSIIALNGHIHDQIERLLNPDLTDEQIKREVEIGRAVASLSAQSIAIANTVIKAHTELAPKDAKKLLEHQDG